MNLDGLNLRLYAALRPNVQFGLESMVFTSQTCIGMALDSRSLGQSLGRLNQHGFASAVRSAPDMACELCGKRESARLTGMCKTCRRKVRLLILKLERSVGYERQLGERTMVAIVRMPKKRERKFTHRAVPGIINEVMATFPDGSQLGKRGIK